MKKEIGFNTLKEILSSNNYMPSTADQILDSIIKADQILDSIIKADQEYIIYGAGRIGKEIYSLLKKRNTKVIAFLDQNAQENQCFDSVPVLTVNNFSQKGNKSAHVIISLFTSRSIINDIISTLTMEYITNIIYNENLLACFCKLGLSKRDDLIFSDYKDEILKAFDMLCDDHSRAIYVENLKAYITWDFKQTLQSENTIQYFDVNVPFSKGYSCFVDCGAFVGDSLQEMTKLLKCNSYFGFEPDRTNFEKLSVQANKVSSKLENIFLFPCAVSDYTGLAYFNENENSGSSLAEGCNTGVPVSVVKLDDCIKKSRITMIKMDIEGAETAALWGAKEIITSQQPDLAICVYHKVSDIWEIPLLLRDWVPNYQFYLRCHCPNTMETVLYATVSTN